MSTKIINLMIFITYIIMATVLIMNIYTWFNDFSPSGLGLFLADRIRANPDLYSLGFQHSIIGAILSSIPIVFLIRILHSTNVLYRSVIEMKIFSASNVIRLKKLSILILYWSLSDIVVVPITSYILTYGNPLGDRLIMLSFSWGQFLGLYLSGFIYILSIIIKNGFNIKLDYDNII